MTRICLCIALMAATLVAHVDVGFAQPADAGPVLLDKKTEPQKRTAVREQLKLRMQTGFTAGGSITSDVLQAVAQVVVKKAVRAGWAELSSRLEELAGCNQTPPAFPQTCTTLTGARIEDLLANPKVLVDAFARDVFARLVAAMEKSAVAGIPAATAVTLGALAEGYEYGGIDGAVANLNSWVKKELDPTQLADAVTCPSSKPLDVLWVLGECVVDQTGSGAIQIGDLPTCDFQAEVDKCATLTSPADKAAVREVSKLAATAITTANATTRAQTTVQLFFEWAKLGNGAPTALLDGFERAFLGLVNHDWTATIVGLSNVADALNPKGCDTSKGECTLDKKLLAIMGAVGQFAQTYKTTDPSTAAAAREKVIEDLVTSLVDRTERMHGAVFGLGGALGLFGGARFNSDGSQFAFPVRLTLGVGMQTYHRCACGFHASIEALDLGQYVTYSSGSLDVSSPDLKSVVIAGATVGFWFGSRDTPMFVAAHGAVSPFLHSADGKPTYEAGLMFGVYVPLLDVN